MPTIRRIRHHDKQKFFERIIETSCQDLLDDQRKRFTPADITPNIKHIVPLLMEQGENLILIADLPDLPNAGQIWLGEARDPYTGEIRGYIYDLFVEPEARHKGVGQALMQAVEEASRKRGHKTLALTVAAHNDNALILYRSFGFETERLTLSKSVL